MKTRIVMLAGSTVCKSRVRRTALFVLSSLFKIQPVPGSYRLREQGPILTVQTTVFLSAPAMVEIMPVLGSLLRSDDPGRVQ